MMDSSAWGIFSAREETIKVFYMRHEIPSISNARVQVAYFSNIINWKINSKKIRESKRLENKKNLGTMILYSLLNFQKIWMIKFID